MKIITMLGLSMILSGILFVMKTTEKWKPWLSFYILWMVLPVSFCLVPDYIRFYRTVPGKVIFILSAISTLAISMIRLKKETKKLLVIQQIVSGFNYPIIVLDSWITTFRMIGKLIHFFAK